MPRINVIIHSVIVARIAFFFVKHFFTSAFRCQEATSQMPRRTAAIPVNAWIKTAATSGFRMFMGKLSMLLKKGIIHTNTTAV